jgi:hypothetical protein
MPRSTQDGRGGGARPRCRARASRLPPRPASAPRPAQQAGYLPGTNRTRISPPPGTNRTRISPPPGTNRTRISPPPGTNRTHISPPPFRKAGHARRAAQARAPGFRGGLGAGSPRGASTMRHVASGEVMTSPLDGEERNGGRPAASQRQVSTAPTAQTAVRGSTDGACTLVCAQQSFGAQQHPRSTARSRPRNCRPTELPTDFWRGRSRRRCGVRRRKDGRGARSAAPMCAECTRSGGAGHASTAPLCAEAEAGSEADRSCSERRTASCVT